MKPMFAALTGAVLLLGATQAHAVTVVDRGLPTANLNNAAGANRSNVAWDFQGYGWFAGDDFTIAGTGKYKIDSITFWLVPIRATADNDADFDDLDYKLGDFYSSMAFYLGEASSTTVPLLTSGNFLAGSNDTDNADISISRVLYNGSGGQHDYQGSSSQFIQLFEVTLSNLALVVDGGASYQFGAECRGPNDSGDTGVYTTCFMHATNEALAGSPQDGADNLFRVFYADALLGDATFETTWDSKGGGWDKSSDVNIRVSATAVPEPASLLLMAGGLMGLALAGRRRARRRPDA